MKRFLILCAVALSLGGCITLEQALQEGQRIAQGGAAAICRNYPVLVMAFDTAATTGAVNATTVRDVGVAVDILDTNCPDILAGKGSAVRTVTQTYSILLQAAAAARKQKASARL